MTSPISVMRCGASSWVPSYRARAARQFPLPSNLPSREIQTANLTIKNVDGLLKRHEDCFRTRPVLLSTTLPVLMNAFVRNTPQARSSRPRISSAPFCAAKVAGNGFPPQWMGQIFDGGVIFSAPGVSSPYSIQSIWDDGMGKPRAKSNTGIIYFIASNDRIKIGFTRNLKARMSSYLLHISSFEQIGISAGTVQFEKAIHQHLAAYRLTGEWFRDCPEVRAEIARIIADGPEAIDFVQPVPKQKPQFVREPLTPEKQRAAWRRLLDLFWPDDPIGGFAQFCQVDRTTIIAWLNGSEEIPDLIRYAFVGKLMEYLSEGYLNQNQEEEL